MVTPKYTVISFEQRKPTGVDAPAQGDWFYYEVGYGTTVTLTGYRSGTQEEVEHAIESIVERINREKPASATGPAARLIFPTITVTEDEDGNATEEEEPTLAPDAEL